MISRPSPDDLKPLQIAVIVVQLALDVLTS